MKNYNYLIFSIALMACSKGKLSNKIDYTDNVVQEAQRFAPGIISTEENSEFAPAFSPDGRSVYFSRRAPGKKQKIFKSNFQNQEWSDPEITSFSIDRDEEPSITPNGELLFFGSERPIPGKPNKGNFDMNIWMMKKKGEGWTEPSPLPFPINDVQIEGEEWPSSNNNFLFPIDNETFYFTTMVRGSDAVKLFETQYKHGAFTEPAEISGLFEDEKYWVYSAVVSPDGKYLVFNSYDAPGGAGGEDIYIAKRIKDKWSKAIAIGSMVNSLDEESGPRFSRDGKYFFFTRAKNLGNYEYGEWDIFFIETEYLELDELFDDTNNATESDLY